MPSGLQDLLSIIDKGYEAEQRREDRQVQTTLALLESGARRKQQREEMALRSEKLAFEKGAKMIELAQSVNDMSLTKSADLAFSTFGGGLYDVSNTSNPGKALKSHLNTVFKDYRKDPLAVNIYNTLAGYAIEPERYRESMLDLGESVLNMQMTDMDEDGIVKIGSDLAKMTSLGVTSSTLESFEAIPVSRANEKDISREIYEFTTGDYEIQSPIATRTYEDIQAQRYADAYESLPDIFNSLNEIEFTSLLESFYGKDEAARIAKTHGEEGQLAVWKGRNMGGRLQSIDEGQTRVDPATGDVYEIIVVPTDRVEGNYEIRNVNTNENIVVPAYVAGKLNPQ